MTVVKLFFAVLFLLPLSLWGQSVETKKETSLIDGVNALGYQVVLPGPEDDVASSLTRYLKGLGKTRSSADHTTVTEPVIAGKKYPGLLYATCKQTGNTSTAWIGVADDGKGSAIDRNIEKLVYDFGVAYHREQIQVQIDESLRALQVVEKQQQRLVNQNKDLHNRIESNKLEKIQLEKSLVQNKAELEQLNRNLAANGQAQDSVSVAVGQIRKVVEMHKQRQQRIK